MSTHARRTRTPRPINGTSYLPHPGLRRQSAPMKAAPPPSTSIPSSSSPTGGSPLPPASSPPSRADAPEFLVQESPETIERRLAAEDRAMLYLSQHQHLRATLVLIIAIGGAFGWIALLALLFTSHHH